MIRCGPRARESQPGVIVDSAQEVHHKRQRGLGRKNMEVESKMPRVMGGGMSNDQNRREVVHIKEMEARDLH